MVFQKYQSRGTTLGSKHENQGTSNILSVMYTNMDGFISGLLELRDYIKDSKPDVVCLTETKLKEEVQLGIIVEGYNYWRRDRKGKSGGGVLIMVKNDILVEEVEFGDGMAEVISIVIKTNGWEKRKIIVTYVPPKTNAWELEKYKEMQYEVWRCLDDMIRKSRRVLLVGDFNCKDINWNEMEMSGNDSPWCDKLIQLAMVNTMEQWVDEVTRCRGEEEPSLIDLVFTKKPETRPEIKFLSPMGKSDHVVIEITLKEEEVTYVNEEYRKGRLNHAKADFMELKRFYGNIEWKKLLEGKQVQEKYAEFLKIYNEGAFKYVPKYNVRRSKYSWYNARCSKAKKDKDTAWRKMRKQWNVNTREEYKKARNEYVKIRREEEKNFEKDIVNKCKDEPKLFYRYINGKLKHKDHIIKLRREGRIYETAEEMCELMNESFKWVFTEETSFVEPPRDAEHQEGMQDIKVDRQEIRKLLENLDVRKAIGPDDVSGWILKECRDQLVEPIWDIIDSSLKEGKVPKEWKRANIVPIYKGGDKTDPLNYRPVSLTSVLGKICETIIKERWVKYLEDNRIITDRQFGFRKGKSCVTNLLSFYTRVIDVVQERNGWVDAVYLDLKKAFDKVPHRRLIWKLENIGGLKGNVLNWMKDYLHEREMRTIIRDSNSSWCEVTSGVPQGSVLAPIMFQVYINDMAEGLSSYINLFADDAKLLKIIKSQDDCKVLQADIDKIHDWSIRWKLEFNAKKCHVLEMGKSIRRPSWNYRIGEEMITKSKEEKDLGVIIQDTLTPDRHIGGIFGASYRMLTNIRIAFNYLDKDIMKRIIMNMIRPKLEYAAVVWSPHKKKDIRKLERIQRTATKMVPELKDLNYEERLEEMGLPTLQKRRERGDLITMYKLVNQMEKVDRQDLVRHIEEGTRCTRGHVKKIRKNRCTGDIMKYSFPYRTVDIWNELKEEVVIAANVHMFKEKLDAYRYGDRS